MVVHKDKVNKCCWLRITDLELEREYDFFLKNYQFESSNIIYYNEEFIFFKFMIKKEKTIGGYSMIIKNNLRLSKIIDKKKEEIGKLLMKSNY